MFRCDFDVMENLKEFGGVNTAVVSMNDSPTSIVPAELNGAIWQPCLLVQGEGTNYQVCSYSWIIINRGTVPGVPASNSVSPIVASGWWVQFLHVS